MTAFTWKTNTTGNWSAAARWSPSGGPPQTSGDTAGVLVAGTYTVTLNANETIGGLTLTDAGATLAIGGNSLTITNSGTQVGTAVLTAGHVTIAGGTISTTGGISVAAADIVGTGTLGGTGSLSGVGVVRASGGTLTISANVASGVTGLQIGTGTNTLALGGALGGLDTITFQSATDTLSLTSATSVSSFASAANTISLTSFVAGDKIHIGSGATVTKVALSHPTLSTTDLNVSLSGGGTAVFHLTSAETNLFANWTTTDISLSANPCYLAGTRILTARGEVAVEELKVGDLLVTQTREALPIRWIGTRDHVVRLIPSDERQKLLPIRFARGSLGHGLPRRDLFILPEHCVSIDGVLIPAYELVNGSTIDFDDLEVIRYFHLELPCHSVIYAEGAAAESYLDTGNRNMFANALDSLLCAEPVRTEPCQPIVASGPVLGEIRSRLATQAELLEAASTVWSSLAAWRAQPQHMDRATQSF